MIARQPVPHVRRQQKPLLTPTFNEVLRHAGMVPKATDGTPLRDNLSPAQLRGFLEPADQYTTERQAEGALPG